jgi:hypothetical protein
VLEFWNEELGPEREEALLDQAAEAIAKRGMTVPAIIALEMHKPLAHVGGHAAVAISPFIVPFFGFDRVNEYSQLLSSRANVERLICRLERPVVPCSPEAKS